MFIYHDYLMFLHAQVNQKSTKSIWNNWIIPKQEKKKKKSDMEKKKVTAYQINILLYITNDLG